MDIILLTFLSFKIFKQAKEKNEKPWLWVFRLVLLFLTTEMVVAVIVLSYFGMEKLSYAVLPALIMASISSYFIFKQLDNTSANYYDDFDEIDEDSEEGKKPNLDYFR